MGGKPTKKEQTGVQIDGLLKTYEKGYKNELSERDRREGRDRCNERFVQCCPCMKWYSSAASCLKRSRLVIIVLVFLAIVIAIGVVLGKSFWKVPTHSSDSRWA